MNIIKIISPILFLLFANFSWAKIDISNPYKDLYDNECGCSKIKDKNIKFYCLRSQLNCGKIFDIPSCIVSQKDNSSLDSTGDIFSGTKDGLSIINSLANMVNSGIKGYTQITKIIRTIRRKSY